MKNTKELNYYIFKIFLNLKKFFLYYIYKLFFYSFVNINYLF